MISLIKYLGATATFDHYAVVDLSVFPVTASVATLVLNTVVRALHSSFPVMFLGTNDFLQVASACTAKTYRVFHSV